MKSDIKNDYVTEMENYSSIGSISGDYDATYQNCANSIKETSVTTRKLANVDSNLNDEIKKPKMNNEPENCFEQVSNRTLIIILIVSLVSCIISITALALVLVERNSILNYKRNF